MAKNEKNKFVAKNYYFLFLTIEKVKFFERNILIICDNYINTFEEYLNQK